MNKMLMDKTVTTSSYVASVSTAIGGLFSLSNIALFIGIATTVILFVMQYRLNKKRRQQDSEYHAARMEALFNGNIVADIEQKKMD